MRRKEKQMDYKEIVPFIKTAKVGRLGVIYQGQPYVVPLSFIYLEGDFYFHCAKEGQKIDALNENDTVCFEISEMEKVRKNRIANKWGIKYKSVIVLGYAKEVNVGKEKRKIMNALMEKYAGRKKHPLVTMVMQKMVKVIKIKVLHITGKQDKRD